MVSKTSKVSTPRGAVAMLVLDSQKLEFSIPFKGVYDFASATLKKFRFGAVKSIIEEKQRNGIEVKAVALDGKTENFFRQNKIPFIPRRDVTEDLYDIKYGEITFDFLRNLIKILEQIDPQSTYRGILLPYLDEKNLWRSFVFPAIKSVDTFIELIKKYKPNQAIILNNAHFFQKLFMLTAQSNRIIVEDRSGSFSHLPWKAKRFAIENLGFLNYPSYFRKLKPRHIYAHKKTKKKILIAHDCISPAKVIPWAKKLTKKYDVVYIGVHENGEKFEKAGIRYRRLQDYATESALASIHALTSIFRKEFRKIFGNPELREALYYKNIDLSKALDEMLLYMYYIGYPTLVTYIELFSQMIAAELPDLIVTVDELSRFGRILISVGNKKGVKTLIVQHGAIWDHALFDGSLCTKFAAYGEQTKKILRKRGVRKDQIVITGQAEDTPTVSREKIRRKICTKLSVSSKKPVITFTSQALAESVNYPSFEVLYETIKEMPKVQFVIKLHPDESDKLHREFIRKLDLKNVMIIKDINIKELLIASDLIINIYSTVGMEALSLGRPLVSINVNFPNKYFPSGRGAYIVRYTKHLKDVINNIVINRNSPSAEKIKKGSKYYIKEIGEKACKNVVNLIDKMVE